MIWSPAWYSKSWLVRDHIGPTCATPPFDICPWPPCPDAGGGNARTYTTGLPPVVDSDAIHRPSGENSGEKSENWLLRNCSVVPAFICPLVSSSVTVQICGDPC